MSKSFKRSKKAALILMVPTATLLLAGCGSEEPVETAVYQNAEECAAFYNPPAECNAEFAKAQELHAQVAPKYQSKAECETDFGAGNCETPATAAVSTDPNAPVQQQQQASSGFFMPMMMGFLAGQMLNRGGQAAPQKSVPTQPLYKSRDDQSTYRTAGNQPVARQSGVTSVLPSQMQPKAGTVVRRGGFGAQAQQRQSMTSGG